MLLPVRLDAVFVPVPVVPLVASVPVAETFCERSALEESERLLPALLPPDELLPFRFPLMPEAVELLALFVLPVVEDDPLK